MNLSEVAKIDSRDIFVNIQDKEHLLKQFKKNLQNKKTSIYFYLNAGVLYSLVSDNFFLRSFFAADKIYLNSSLLELLLKLIYNNNYKKLNAEDFIYDIFNHCEKEKKKVFLFGSTKKGIGRAITYIKTRNPNIFILGNNGYFKNNDFVVNKINKFKPDILFIGLGMLNQENWVYQNREKLKKIKAVIAVGNYIDILGGARKLPPPVFKKYGLEWFYRLITEPRRLWRRYFLGGFVLLMIVIYHLIRSFKRLMLIFLVF